MPKSFLGKNAVKKNLPDNLPRPRRPFWLLYYFLIFLVLGSFTVVSRFELIGSSSHKNTRTILASSTTNTELGVRVLAATATTPDCAKSVNYLKDASRIGKVFPLIPEVLNSESVIVDGQTYNCTPPYWNSLIIWLFVYKAMILLNFLAYFLAVILTVVAGIYYISGFANEGLVKKGKSILITTYVGLIIVLSARFILYGTIQFFTSQAINPKQVIPGNLPGITNPRTD